MSLDNARLHLNVARDLIPAEAIAALEAVVLEVDDDDPQVASAIRSFVGFIDGGPPPGAAIEYPTARIVKRWWQA